MKKKALIYSTLVLFAAYADLTPTHAKSAEKYLILYNTSAAEIQKQESRESQIRDLVALTKKREEEVFASSGILSMVERESLWLVTGTVAQLTKNQVERLSLDSKVKSIQLLNRKAHLAEGESAFAAKYTYGLESLGLPSLMLRRPDLDGSGVKVGIIDTGIDANHPDLRGRTVAFRDFISGRQQPYDDHGHGTHVAGLVGGGEYSGTQIGVAPKVEFVIAKGFGRYGGFEEKGLLAAMQWMADPDGNPQTNDAPQVISSSWNVDGDVRSRASDQEVFCLAIDRLALIGIISVFSAGNDGPGQSSIKIPGACPGAITVGSIDQDNEIAESSSRGPIPWKNKTVAKPEVVAPGVSIYSSLPGGSYGYKTGTSMATPYVAGALALLLQSKNKNPQIDYRQILLESAFDLGPNGFDPAFGFGLVDLPSAIGGIWSVQ